MQNQSDVGTDALVGGTNPENQAPLNLVLPSSGFTKAAAQADSTATDIAGLKTDFNALLAKLRTAGVISTP